MKTLICYVLIIAAAISAPVEKADVAKLRPIEVIYIYKDADAVILKTDTEDVGIGADVENALQDMKLTSPAVIYLDTAEYLLLEKDTQEDAEALRSELKPSVRLCMCNKPIDLAEAAKYLGVHGNLPKMKEWKVDTELPLLSTFGDSLIFLKKVENSA